MMSGVASRCQVRYHQVMKHANLLQYAAALAVFAGIVTWVAMWQWTEGFGDILKRKSWLILGIPLGISYWLTGVAIDIALWISNKVVWLIHAHAELWGFKRTSKYFSGLLWRMTRYWVARNYQPKYLA